MQYRVKALSVGGKNNKIFKSGDIVEPSNFSAPIQDLVDGGFIEIIGEQKQKSQPATNHSNESGSNGNVAGAVVDVADYTKKHVEAVLAILQIEFEQKDKKQILWDQLFNSGVDHEKVVALLNAQKEK